MFAHNRHDMSVLCSQMVSDAKKTCYCEFKVQTHGLAGVETEIGTALVVACYLCTVDTNIIHEAHLAQQI